MWWCYIMYIVHFKIKIICVTIAYSIVVISMTETNLLFKKKSKIKYIIMWWQWYINKMSFQIEQNDVITVTAIN
jgi:hypothetical protein